MGDNRFSCSGNGAGERFGIEASRILDACRDRDCFEDVRVFLTCGGEELIARTGNVRVKCAEIVASNISVDPVQFNIGFYTVLVRFYVRCEFEVCVPMGQSQIIEGIAVLEKRVVLFGGQSNVSIFRSKACDNFCAAPEPVCCGHNNPEAVIEVVQPVVLGARILEECNCHCCCCCCDIPAVVADSLGGALGGLSMLGLLIYTIVSLLRGYATYGELMLLVICLFAGIQLFFTGMIGEYILVMNDRIKKRPLVVEEVRLNFESAEKKELTNV